MLAQCHRKEGAGWGCETPRWFLIRIRILVVAKKAESLCDVWGICRGTEHGDKFHLSNGKWFLGCRKKKWAHWELKRERQELFQFVVFLKKKEIKSFGIIWIIEFKEKTGLYQDQNLVKYEEMLDLQLRGFKPPWQFSWGPWPNPK